MTRRRCDYATEERLVEHYQIFRGELSVSAGHEFVLDLLAFVEAGQSRAFNGGGVDKHIVAALVGLDETVPYGWFEPLHDPGRHDHFLSLEYSQRQARAINRMSLMPPRECDSPALILRLTCEPVKAAASRGPAILLSAAEAQCYHFLYHKPLLAGPRVFRVRGPAPAYSRFTPQLQS